MPQQVVGSEGVADAVNFAVLAKECLNGLNTFSNRLNSRVVNNFEILNIEIKVWTHRVDDHAVIAAVYSFPDCSVDVVICDGAVDARNDKDDSRGGGTGSHDVVADDTTLSRLRSYLDALVGRHLLSWLHDAPHVSKRR